MNVVTEPIETKVLYWVDAYHPFKEKWVPVHYADDKAHAFSIVNSLRVGKME